MIASALIALSIREGRTVTEYPDTAEDARALVETLAVEAADDCTIEHRSGSESVGYYDIWGTDEDGDEWRVHVVTAEIVAR